MSLPDRTAPGARARLVGKCPSEMAFCAFRARRRACRGLGQRSRRCWRLTGPQYAPGRGDCRGSVFPTVAAIQGLSRWGFGSSTRGGERFFRFFPGRSTLKRTSTAGRTGCAQGAARHVRDGKGAKRPGVGKRPGEINTGQQAKGRLGAGLPWVENWGLGREGLCTSYSPNLRGKGLGFVARQQPRSTHCKRRIQCEEAGTPTEQRDFSP